jgi:putative membrane-bound dehydrogenase-like protein
MKAFRTVAVVSLAVLSLLALRAEPPSLKPPALKSPQEEKATFQLHPGFKIELVACEPQIVDPVAMAFDQDGRLYVAEMRGYPNGGFGTGKITSGSIKLLEDRDGDGFYETATTFADGLRFPMSIQPWKKGILVAVAPDLMYMEDTDGDGKADVKKIHYTGFGVDNIQQMLNSFSWGLDNWIYASNGASGGTIRSVEKPDSQPLNLGNRGIRFKPDVPGSLEPMSGGGQYGLTADIGQHWFTNTNSQHIRQIILPDHYLRRNPALAAPNPTVDIPEHGAACKVYRISPFEAWRVERTTRRAGGADASRFPKTELVPGGYSTSSCSPTIYLDDRFPKDYCGNAFICEPANNLVLRVRLEENGAVFKATRPDASKEFLASTDNSFRPVHLTVGPDGALYVVDFYRPVIETPRSLPDDMKATLPLETQQRGRIWRIVRQGQIDSHKPNMSHQPSTDLVEMLDWPGSWWRFNAQRLLVERQDKTVAGAVRKLFGEAKHDFGRMHVLCTLHGLNSLDDDSIAAALKDDSPYVREQGLRLAEERMKDSARLRQLVAERANDPSPRVRMQAAFSLGADDGPESIAGLSALIQRDAGDPWIMAAVLSSTRTSATALLERLLNEQDLAQAQRQLAARLASQVGAAGSDAAVGKVLSLIAAADRASWRDELLLGLGQGLQNTSRPLR